MVLDTKNCTVTVEADPMFENLRRQKAYLWYARVSELNQIKFWKSVVDDVERLKFQRDPETRLGRLTQEMRQLEGELGRDFIRSVAQQEQWRGILPDWLSPESPTHRSANRAS